MTIALVGSRLNTGSTGSTSSRSSSAASHTSGNLLVALTSCQSTWDWGTIADTAGNTWYSAIARYNSNNRMAIWYAYNITGHASNVVTHTATGVYGTLSVFEFSGNWGTSNPLANTNYGNGNGTSLTSNSITIARNAVGVGFGLHNVNAFNAGTNSYIFGSHSVGYFGDLYKVNVASSEAVTGSATSSSNWWVIGAMFQEQEASGGVFPHHLDAQAFSGGLQLLGGF